MKPLQSRFPVESALFFPIFDFEGRPVIDGLSAATLRHGNAWSSIIKLFALSSNCISNVLA